MIREHLRVLAGTAAGGFLVGALVGGVLGRLAMRLLVLTSDDRVDGAITDDDAVVNQLTLSGTLGLVFFLGIGGVALAWLYVGARRSLPEPMWQRSAVWAVLLWAVMGAQVFDPDGFDFTQLSPVWLGVLLFTAIFLAVGALIPIVAERAIARWTPRPVGYLPLLLALPAFPLYGGGVVAAVGADASEQWRVVRVFGALVMVAIAVLVGVPVVGDVVQIL